MELVGACTVGLAASILAKGALEAVRERGEEVGKGASLAGHDDDFGGHPRIKRRGPRRVAREDDAGKVVAAVPLVGDTVG